MQAKQDETPDGKLYEDALRGMCRILQRFGIHHWANWLTHDLDEWHEHRNVDHHLSAYGGMGSFTDLIICAPNGHPIDRDDEPWVNSALKGLQSVSFTCAATHARPHLRRVFSIDELSLMARDFGLPGQWCRHCTYIETAEGDVEWWLARREVKRALLDAAKRARIADFTETVLGGDLRRSAVDRPALLGAIRSSGIPIVPRSCYPNPCPLCGAKDIAVCYWDVETDPVFSLSWSKQNIPRLNQL